MSGEDVYTEPCPDTSPTGGDVRQRIVDLARPCAGLSYRPETRDAYVKLLFDGEDEHRALDMARTMSSCGLFVRACWRLFGLQDERLRAPYHIGQVMFELQGMAREAGAWRPASAIADVQPGDAVFLGGPDHVLLVEYKSLDVLHSIDGGQRDAHGFYGILACIRTIKGASLVGRWGARPIEGWISWPEVVAKFGA